MLFTTGHTLRGWTWSILGMLCPDALRFLKAAINASHVDTYVEKYAIEKVVSRVEDVKAIAAAAESAFKWHAGIPEEKIQVQVEKGCREGGAVAHGLDADGLSRQIDQLRPLLKATMLR